MPSAHHRLKRDRSLLYQLPSDYLSLPMQGKDEDDRSLLHSACASGSLQLVQWLVERGARQVNAADEEVRCALCGGGRACLAGRGCAPECALCGGGRAPAACCSVAWVGASMA